jgi:hypothetical protein
MQTNPHKGDTRSKILEILLKEMPKGATYIRCMTNGGCGPTALQLEEQIASFFPCGQFDSIECFGKKIPETLPRLRQLNKKFEKCHFRIIKGYNDQFETLEGIDISEGYDLIWYDGVSRFSPPHLRFLQALERSAKRGIFKRAWKNGYHPIFCLTVALQGRGASTPFRSLKYYSKPWRKWVNKPSSEERAENIIQGVHAMANAYLSKANVKLEPVYAEVYRGRLAHASTPMALLIWRAKRGQFKGQMFERIINNIQRQIRNTLIEREQQWRQQVSQDYYRRIISDPHKLATRMHRLLPEKSGIKLQGDTLHYCWMPKRHIHDCLAPLRNAPISR